MKIHKFNLGVAIALPLLAGSIGSIATISSVQNWYLGLQKPLLNPPASVFGPVWTVLYLMMGIALYLILIKPESHKRKQALTIYGVQLLLNSLWSIAFFGAKSPELGVLVISGLLISVWMTYKRFNRLDNLAGKLLIPYMAWISFASYLNVGVAMLN